MKFFNLILLFLISTIFLSACDTKRNPYFGDDDAQFYLGSIELKSTVNAHFNSDGEVDRKEINLIACLKNLSGGALPPKLKFEILAGNQSLSRITDKNGCLEWKESHGFDPKSDYKNLKLVRTFNSKSDYNGKRTQEIYWSPHTGSLVNNIDSKAQPQNTEDPLEIGFETGDITLTHQSVNRSNSDSATPNPNNSATTGSGSDLAIPAETNLETSNSPALVSQNQTRLVLTSVDLTHLKLNQGTPFSVDQNLTLYAKHTYQFSASPKFYVKSFDNLNSEQNPPAGKYKITLAFMDDPQFDLEKLALELNQNQTLEDLNKNSTSEGKRLHIATQMLASKKEISVNGKLSATDKKKILAKSILSHVHTTTQFVADKNAEQAIIKYLDIELKKLASLDIRSVLAVTIESVGIDQKQKLKAHGIGYVNNLLSPGSITLIKTSIEADLIYDQYRAAQEAHKKISPFNLFLQTSNEQLKDKSLVALDLKSIPQNQFPQTVYPIEYPFAKELEMYFKNSMNLYKKDLFHRAICNKIFVNETTKSMEKSNQKFPDEQRLLWAFRCHSGHGFRAPYYDVSVLDFVESTKEAQISKVGQTITEEFMFSKSFSNSTSTSSSTKKSFDSSITLDSAISAFSNFLVDGLVGTVQAANPVVGSALGILKSAFPISFGGSWGHATSSSQSQDRNTSVSQGSSQKLSVHIDTFKMNLETRRCALISYRPWVVNYFKSEFNVALKKGFFVCSEKATKPQYYEKYYTVSQACSQNSATTDCASEDESRLRMMIRGENTYEMFKNTMMNENFEILITPLGSEALEQQKMQWTSMIDSALTTQVFPGALTPVFK